MSHDPPPPSFPPTPAQPSPASRPPWSPYPPYAPPPSPARSTPHTPPPSFPPPPAHPWQPPAPPGPPPRPDARAPRAPLGHHSDLRLLRSAYRWQRRTATLTALGYFTLFLVMSACAPGFMTDPVADGVPAGLLLALFQLPVTWLAIALYEHTTRRRVDPLADRIRRQAELDARRGATR
ncbi:DUF485 domain-containing protein [Streptomyces sp. NPDC013455]|uniref:DUF485 domain-containing protein n=1 Tax=Streptomyces sp. NPDC013455 TaxID=3155605 RepID=UPI0034078BF6